MSKILNLLFVILFPIWMLNIYNCFVLGDHTLQSCGTVAYLSIYFTIAIPIRISYIYKTHKFFYEEDDEA